MLKIIPSILTDNLVDLNNLINLSESVAERVHIDIIDGVFSEAKTPDPISLQNYEGNILFDYHLMVKEPINWVEKCVLGQADRIIGQIEEMSDQIAFIGKVQQVGAKVGLAIDLNTSVSQINPVILNNLDVVLVMAVKAGRGGQVFEKLVLEKIKELDIVRSRDKTPFVICVDGGVNESNLKSVRYAGADEVAIGRRLFNGSLEDNIKKHLTASYE